MAAKLILAALLVAVNAFFVIAEYALVRSRRARLEVMREQGQRGASLALASTSASRSTYPPCQIGVTMLSLAIGALGYPTLAARAQGGLRRRRSATASRS